MCLAGDALLPHLGSPLYDCRAIESICRTATAALEAWSTTAQDETIKCLNCRGEMIRHTLLATLTKWWGWVMDTGRSRCTCAPNASSSCAFSAAASSGIAMRQRQPCAAATIARLTPVLPDHEMHLNIIPGRKLETVCEHSGAYS